MANVDVEVWDRTMAVNLGGVFRPLREAIPDMLDRGGGRAVAVASIASAIFGDATFMKAFIWSRQSAHPIEAPSQALGFSRSFVRNSCAIFSSFNIIAATVPSSGPAI